LGNRLNRGLQIPIDAQVVVFVRKKNTFDIYSFQKLQLNLFKVGFLMEDGAKGSSPTTRGSRKLVIALGLLLAICAGIGIGIGIGAGIWKDNGASANDSTVLATQTCPEGEHNAALNTYFLTTSRVNVSDLPNPYKQDFGRFFEITIPKSSLPPTVPFVKTVMGEGKVYEDVLNSTEFLEMWSKLSATADPDNGTFAMPGLDEAHWCFQQYKAKFDALASGKGLAKSPANALLAFDTDSKETLVADIFAVIDAGESYLMQVRLAPTNATMDTNESECHSYQSVNDPHYHHRSRCLSIETDEELVSSEDVNGRGLTAFIKITPFIDSAVVAGVADVITDAVADAGVDAATDTATDAATDTASDSATDTASDTSNEDASEKNDSGKKCVPQAVSTAISEGGTAAVAGEDTKTSVEIGALGGGSTYAGCVG
jgi:hypothetical protein